MKRKITAAIAVFFTTISIASSVFAHDGTVNFTGKIIEAGCKIDGNVTTDKDVELGEISRTAFTTSGDTAATTPFSLVLTECPASLLGKSVNVKYEGTPDNINNDYLQLTGYGDSGVAKGVAIELLNADLSSLPLGTESNAVNIQGTADAPAETNLNFFARYVSTEASVTAGTANATVNFTLTYN
ncbi:fimbrial protein [Salmonella enterica subsp. houtenae]|nr:type 1 fimbrial protein [Salmonella enterica subsp. houtenae]ECI3632151.1 fimbrial protein [Salmonella enterica subsp. houtenae]ECI3707256.1 fimbrial protein [Salmonella enterica subsp. houtenae]MLR85217.1 type 1 fimbrial protein [Salmonella enterica subsp. houtenae]